MPQATQLCPSSVHICALRVTLLNNDGSVATGPHNSYVTDDVIQLNVTPDILAGDSKQVVSGCDCISVSYRGFDKLMRFNLELDLAKWEPNLLSMMTGGSLVMDSSTTPVAKGLWWPEQNSCSSALQPKVAIEAWSDMWASDAPLASLDADGVTELQFIHWIFPASHWHIDQSTLQNDFDLPKLMGFTRSNTAFGSGPYGDLPEACGPQGGFVWTSTRPTASCSFKTASSG